MTENPQNDSDKRRHPPDEEAAGTGVPPPDPATPGSQEGAPVETVGADSAPPPEPDAREAGTPGEAPPATQAELSAAAQPAETSQPGPAPAADAAAHPAGAAPPPPADPPPPPPQAAGGGAAAPGAAASAPAATAPAGGTTATAPAGGTTAPAGGAPTSGQPAFQRPPAHAPLSLPNILTAARCLSVIVIVVLLIWPWGPLMTAALVVFGIAALTDWLDGRLARWSGMTSDLGRMLDHIADKLLVGVTMLALCAIGVIDGLNVIAAALILAREIAISGLREHLGPRGVVVPASDLAKWKTTFQMVALAAIMAAPLAPFETVARVAALLILWAAMGMTVVSGYQYAWGTREAWDKE